MTRKTLLTESGTRICALPVSADLYWLFLQDTQSAHPDAPCLPAQDKYAIGMWATEARAFVSWINSIAPISISTSFRLPAKDDLGKEVVDALTQNLPAHVIGAWVLESAADKALPTLWVRLSGSYPYVISGDQIRAAIASDVRHGMLKPIVSAVAIDAALNLITVLRLERDYPRSVITENYCDAALGTVKALTKIATHTGHDDVAKELTALVDCHEDGYLALEANLATEIVQRLGSIMGLDFGPDLILRATRPHMMHNEFDPEFAAIRARVLDAMKNVIIEFDEAKRVPLAWILESALANSLYSAPAPDDTPGHIYDSFADRLTSSANITRADLLRVTPTASLSEILGSLTPRDVKAFHAKWGDLVEKEVISATRLTDAAAPPLGIPGGSITSDEAVARILALTFAAEISDISIFDIFLQVAAKITLFQLRAQGKTEIGECIILAIA
jgi:hypothetical protein